MNMKVLRRYMAILIACVCFLSLSPVIGGSVPEATKDSVNPDPFLQRVKTLQQMDAAGLSEYQTERDAELAKLELAQETGRASKLGSPKIDEYLSLLSQRKGSVAATNVTVLTDEGIRGELMHARIVPVWSGTNWINGNLLAINGFSVSDRIEEMLASLNYFDAMSRHYSGPDGDVQGEYRGKVKLIRNHFLYLNYTVKYDKTFDIWRITGTNVPAASPAP